MDILELGSNLLKQHLGTSANNSTISNALAQLLGGSGGQLNLGNLVALLSSNEGLQNVVNSWLGNGQNAPISPSQILSLFGEGKIKTFAGQLGVSSNDAAGGLANALPQMIDKGSSTGSLLETALVGALDGNRGGLGGMLGGLFKK